MLEMTRCFAMEKNMELMKKDVSPFLLFEASGDSEAAAEVVSDGPISVAMAVDDAESCSCDSADISSADELIINGDDDDDHGDKAYHSHVDDHEEEEEEEGGSSVYQRWGHQLKSTVSVDSTKEFERLNEVEKSKLFWEACLAS